MYYNSEMVFFLFLCSGNQCNLHVHSKMVVSPLENWKSETMNSPNECTGICLGDVTVSGIKIEKG